jgi:hypothetical protein
VGPALVGRLDPHRPGSLLGRRVGPAGARRGGPRRSARDLRLSEQAGHRRAAAVCAGGRL